MLKFQDDYTTLIATFEDFILLVYTIMDTCTNSLSLLLFHKEEMWITQKCPTRKSLP